MAGVSISVETRPDMLTALRGLGLTKQQTDRAHRRTLTALGAWMVREMRDALKPTGHQGQPGGDKWKDISPAWRAFKASEGYSTHIGIYRGHMQNSLSFDVRAVQLEVEAGPTVEHAEDFDSKRPITPKEEYVLSRAQITLIDAYEKESR